MPGFRASAPARHKAVDLVRRGATFTAAAEAVGVSDFAVRQWCKADGVASVRGRRGDRGGGAGTLADAADSAPVTATGRLRPELAALEARLAAAERRATAAEKRAAAAEQRIHALLAAHPR